MYKKFPSSTDKPKDQVALALKCCSKTVFISSTLGAVQLPAAGQSGSSKACAAPTAIDSGVLLIHCHAPPVTFRHHVPL